MRLTSVLRIGFAFAFGLLVAATNAAAPTHARHATPPSPSSNGVHDFDFLAGDWRVHHRREKPGTRDWIAFEGTCSNRVLLNGAANIEEHALQAPSGAYRAIGLRAYDPKTAEWAIWWLDGRSPAGPLDPPVKGRFEKGIGEFFSDYTQDGKPMRVRFRWSDITPTSARWEQALSSDGGTTWATNWIMTFQRDTAPRITQASDRSDVRDFDFLRGDWRVHHRYLRVSGTSRTWADADGTADHRALMGGRANIEEHTIHAPSGVNRGLSLRSYDPATSRWSIWWLDGRAPHGTLDPPVRGGFVDGVGTFYGDTTVNGRPTRVRFIWSQITAASARWEQAYSSDDGKTWEPNWIMEFRRGS